MSFFWIDSKRSIEIRYEEFFKQVNFEGENNIYIYKDNPYDVFLNLVRNLINNSKSIILDADFSKEELLSIGLSNDIIDKGVYQQPNLSTKLKSFEDLLDFLDSKSNDLLVEIYTSGTTGRPKKVTQTLKNIIRAVKAHESMKHSVWGFAYNPTHFAGLQVFFQAFFNKNTMVYLFNKDYQDVYQDFVDFSITNLSSTPTYMKMLIPSIKEPLNSVKSLTFGGEKFNPKLEKKIKEKFPNAAVKNVYASTEAGSLLRAEGEYFTIPERYKKFVIIKDGELLIHKELLGNSSSFELTDSWFKTGDLVEFVDEMKFKFVNRKSEMINVGGYKVNPNEVEEVINEIDSVKDVVVFGRKNSLLGNIIEANVVKQDSEDDFELKKMIKQTVRIKLQEYKVPRKINFVDSLSLTRTGKIKKI